MTMTKNNRKGAQPAPDPLIEAVLSDLLPVEPTRPATPLEIAVRNNPNQIHRLIPGGNELLIITDNWDGKHPYGRNSRPTPPIGSPSLRDLIANMEKLTDESKGDYGQLQPCGAILNTQGAAELYFGFHRARAIQTRNLTRPEDKQIPLLVIITDRILTEDEIVARSLAENAFRKDPGPVQIAETVAAFQAQGLGVVEIGKRIGKRPADVSVYSRINLLPAGVKKALESGALKLEAAKTLVTLLPGKVEMRNDPDCLVAAQERVTARVDRMLGKGGGGGTARAAARHRKVSQMLSEIGKLADGDSRMAALVKYMEGGSLKALVRGMK